jgi:hypothetical protein
MFERMDKKLSKKYEMIVFIDTKHLDKVVKCVGNSTNITVIPIDRDFMTENLPMWKRVKREREIMNSLDFRKKFPHRLKFPEHSIPEYSMINHVKIDFLVHAMKITDAQYLCWSDFGYFQVDDRIPDMPIDINSLDKNKINYTLINPIDYKDENVIYTINNAPERIGGFFFLGSRQTLPRYQELYHRIHQWFQDNNIVDDDQHLALQCYFNSPDLFHLHNLGGWHRALTHFQLKETKQEKKMEHLTTIMNRNGSDKGSGHHNYTEFYAELLAPFREKKINVLEIGIGTVNPNIPSSMCGTPGGYFPGASLRGWKEYFPNAEIYGCDIDRNILIFEDRITTFYLDQTDSKSVQEAICDVDRMYDIIIDDGLHHFPTNWAVLKQIYRKLNYGGIYIIEDIVDFDPKLFDDPFIHSKRAAGDTCEFKPIPNPRNTADNNLVVLQKN